MARKVSKREGVLLVLLALVAAVVLWTRGDRSLFGGTKEEPLLPPPAGDAPTVRMDDLVAEAEPFDPNGRNLFQYYTPPPPPRKAPPPAPPIDRDAAARRLAEARKAQRQQAPPPQAGVRAPVPQFRYIGYLGPKDEKIAVLEKGDEVELARIGDVVEEQFRITEFKYEGIVLGYTDTRFKGQTTELQQQSR